MLKATLHGTSIMPGMTKNHTLVVDTPPSLAMLPAHIMQRLNVFANNYNVNTGMIRVQQGYRLSDCLGHD